MSQKKQQVAFNITLYSADQSPKVKSSLEALANDITINPLGGGKFMLGYTSQKTYQRIFGCQLTQQDKAFDGRRYGPEKYKEWSLAKGSKVTIPEQYQDSIEAVFIDKQGHSDI